jgi:hypothetical protein
MSIVSRIPKCLKGCLGEWYVRVLSWTLMLLSEPCAQQVSIKWFFRLTAVKCPCVCSFGVVNYQVTPCGVGTYYLCRLVMSSTPDGPPVRAFKSSAYICDIRDSVASGAACPGFRTSVRQLGSLYCPLSAT